MNTSLNLTSAVFCIDINYTIKQFLFSKVNLEKGTVITVAGNGKQGSDKEGGSIGTSQSVSSPWDVTAGPPPGLYSTFSP